MLRWHHLPLIFLPRFLRCVVADRGYFSPLTSGGSLPGYVRIGKKSRLIFRCYVWVKITPGGNPLSIASTLHGGSEWPYVRRRNQLCLPSVNRIRGSRSIDSSLSTIRRRLLAICIPNRNETHPLGGIVS